MFFSQSFSGYPECLFTSCQNFDCTFHVRTINYTQCMQTCSNFAITDSMSSPTYPAWVNAVQSQIANGTSKQRAIVWARRVFPGNTKHRDSCENEENREKHKSIKSHLYGATCLASLAHLHLFWIGPYVYCNWVKIKTLQHFGLNCGWNLSLHMYSISVATMLQSTYCLIL